MAPPHLLFALPSLPLPNLTRRHTSQRRSYGQIPICALSSDRSRVVTVLDYGAGNVRSLQNAIELLGFDIRWVESASDISSADKLIFPGVGSFGNAMNNLQNYGYVDALTEYLRANRPFLGICLGLHTLFESSEESPGIPGLGVFPGSIGRFKMAQGSLLKVPHIGWNIARPQRPSKLLAGSTDGERYYFVHSFRLLADHVDSSSILATTQHGEEYVSILQHGNICATQFHPEKSGNAGLRLLNNFLTSDGDFSSESTTVTTTRKQPDGETELAKRVVACLDVRENDDGDLVVTKGDQYDVRDSGDQGKVRNLGKPVELAERYYKEGADEVCFLNITSFRGEPVSEAPMLEVLRRVSKRVFVPLCIGGGIRDYVDGTGKHHTALDVADTYFRAGADKISLGSDAVYAAEKYYANGGKGDGTSSIETISKVYGAQAVVVSIDPRRVYEEHPENCKHNLVKNKWWYQCTVKGGREGRDLDAVELAIAAENLGAGEILLNCMDEDGQKNGYDHQLIAMVRQAVSIPVIASSGAGKVSHFTDCFDATQVEAALAAGIFHRGTVTIEQVKQHMLTHGTPVRR